MKRLDLKVGFQCNNRCLFCIQGDKRFSSPNKSDQEIKKILNKMKKDHDSVVFTGGEPTVRKELVNWVSYAKKIGFKTIQIQTNGRMLSYKNYCRALIKAGVNEFGPALHGSNAKIHDSLTQTPGSFKQTTQGITNLRELKQYVITNSVITRMNYKDLPNLAQLLVDLKVDQFQFAFMHINRIIAHNSQLIKKIVPRYQESIPYIKKGIDVGVKAGIKVMAEAIPYCFMKGYEKYISEPYIPSASVVDNELELDDYEYYRKNIGKTKGPQCIKCQHNKICEGPWKEYPEIFGWSEFNPVKK
ncbi:radical SAM protein [Patescibacteria group bacterium]|nr:radical SAM protein [Patescibacteria group bacterium]MBU1499813.1 radical SAM protein [Patescibacteria group bacterium]